MIDPIYSADVSRYEKMIYRRCGESGLQLPVISIGLWHNFGHVNPLSNQIDILKTAFDNGITHFDLANNYGPPYGSAEENFGTIYNKVFKPYRDELIISSKAGYDMWPGPYGIGGSRKYLIASIDQSLKRMGLEYVDIFYSHRFDAETPLEETVLALDHIVKSGKALYVGISNYNPEQTERAIRLFEELKTPFIIHQAKYSMFVRTPEEGLLDTLNAHKKGAIVFSPLAQGLLTDKYLNGIPTSSRAGGNSKFLNKENITDGVLNKVSKLNDLAAERNQSLAQMAISWLLRTPTVSSVLVGASSSKQLLNSIKSIENLSFSYEELFSIDRILAE